MDALSQMDQTDIASLLSDILIELDKPINNEMLRKALAECAEFSESRQVMVQSDIVVPVVYAIIFKPLFDRGLASSVQDVQTGVVFLAGAMQAHMDASSMIRQEWPRVRLVICDHNWLFGFKMYWSFILFYYSSTNHAPSIDLQKTCF